MLMLDVMFSHIADLIYNYYPQLLEFLSFVSYGNKIIHRGSRICRSLNLYSCGNKILSAHFTPILDRKTKYLTGTKPSLTR